MCAEVGHWVSIFNFPFSISHRFNSLHRPRYSFLSAPADDDEPHFELVHRRAEGVEKVLPRIATCVARLVRTPLDVCIHQQIEVRAAAARLVNQPLRATPVVMAAVDDRADEVGIEDGPRCRSVDARELAARDPLAVVVCQVMAMFERIGAGKLRHDFYTEMPAELLGQLGLAGALRTRQTDASERRHSK